MSKYIIDCDPGIDDLIALAYALKNNWNIIGITTVSGNASVEATTLNALKLVSLFAKKVPVVKGSNQALNSPTVHAQAIHGKDGSHGLMQQIKAVSNVEKMAAADFIIDQVLKNPHQIELIVLGPMTNIALAVIKKPTIAQLIKRIVFMGGGHCHGNVTPSAEFNVYADPYAAKAVFEAGVEMVMVGLDATMNEGLTLNEINHLTDAMKPSPENQLVQSLLLKAREVSEGFNLEKAYIHDLITLIYAQNPKIVETKDCYVGIETRGKLTFGKTVIDINGVLKKPTNARVAFKLNKQILIDELNRYFHG